MRRINMLVDEGIEFILDTDVGKDITIDEMIKEYDAVILCTGCTVPRDLKVPGREFDGIYFAVDYLKESTRSVLENKVPQISAKDKDVVIIGGGDTGTDCVAASIRQGARSVNQLEIMPRPFGFRQIDNPWPEWPRIEKVDYGQEEAIWLFGEDPRKYQTTVTRLTGDQDGNIDSVQTADISWKKDPTGRMYPVPVKGSERTIPADLVLIAMGFTGVEDYSFSDSGVMKEEKGRIYTRAGSFATNIDKVFAAGDARRGQSLVVWAMSEGRRVAEEINQYLMRSI
jgi:glutamate synthase (NADPH/NADH) small chain